LIAGVALGGRSSLFGPVLGAIAVGYGRSTLSERFPTRWIYFQGALFIVVVLLLPNGIASLGSVSKSLRSRVGSLWPSKAASADRAPSEPNEALA
jgi:urea transport system permease protein